MGARDGGAVLLLLGLATALAARGAGAQARPFQPPTPPAPAGPALVLTADNCTQTVTLAPPLYQAQEFRLLQEPGLRCVLTFMAAPPEPWRPLQWPSNPYPAYGEWRRHARSAGPGPASTPASAPALAYTQQRGRGETDASGKARSFSPWGGGGGGSLYSPTASFSYGPPAPASGPAPGAYGPPQPPRPPPTESHHYDHHPVPEFVQVVSAPKWHDAPDPAPSPGPPPPEAWLWWWWWQREAAAAEAPPPSRPPPAAVRARLLVQLRDVNVSPGVFDCELGGARVYSVLQGLPTLLLSVCGADNSSTASLSEDGVAIVTYTSGEVASGSGLTVSVQTIPQAFASYSPPPWQRSWRSRRQGQPASAGRPPFASERLVAPPSYPVLPRPQTGFPPKDIRSESHPYDQVDFYPGGYYYTGGCNNTRWDGRVKPPRK
ncbi:hypothetical protein R5R35_009910 [Gryllus longicercus]|uniref:Uncharacterized protein n=1 Tax=Gryllus longicercus TaxID=2509291 RepID=A0AAN9ZDZ7_9ORTH